MSKIHVELLKKAKEKLNSISFEVRSVGVCYCVKFCSQSYKHDKAAAEILTKINSSIGEGNFVSNWLFVKHGVYLNNKTLREYRLAWIDWMIEGYSKGG